MHVVRLVVREKNIVRSFLHMGLLLGLLSHGMLGASGFAAEPAAKKVPHAPIFVADFRRSFADELWEAEGESTQAGKIEIADDPAEYGVLVRSGSISGLKVRVEPHGYYRIQFRAKTQQKAFWAAAFLMKDGREIVADVYDAIDPSSDWQSHTFYFRAHAHASHMRIRLQPQGAPLSVRNLRVTEATAEEAAQWADGVVAALPIVRFEASPDRWKHLTRTMKRLAAGKPLRIVMLGDSICNDTANSMFETQLARLYPKAKIEVVTNVRGGTGCWYYKDENRVQEYVLNDRPDLLIIAGMSHRFDPQSIRSVVQQVQKKSKCDILVMSGAVTPEGHFERSHLRSKGTSAGLWEMEQFTRSMRRMCREEKVEFLDMRRAWDDYMSRSQVPYDLVSRDPIHANSRGKQVLARILLRYFEPKDD